jgi:hypothetical protein
VAEWLKATVLKTVVPTGTGGSNPSCSGVSIEDISAFELSNIPTTKDLQLSLICPMFSEVLPTDEGQVLSGKAFSVSFL